MSLEHARAVTSAWRKDYNEVRPHSSLENGTPSQFAAALRNHGNLAIHHPSDKLANQDSTK